MTTDALMWLGVAFCITQAAILSGLNLAVFSLSRLRLETASGLADHDAMQGINDGLPETGPGGPGLSLRVPKLPGFFLMEAE
jgi:hypothetical protein